MGARKAMLFGLRVTCNDYTWAKPSPVHIHMHTRTRMVRTSTLAFHIVVQSLGAISQLILLVPLLCLIF